ncbi:hypothetical protein PR003_g11169 [Phytophthora rubi]|uniref:Selenoprotein T n=1 Tax=Phytophthora rubi TaxID=129364 RepID=A0A6A4F909_9STRA|nr:hypothetical protein PR001_g10709 [Phytophthora rubi]KAE9339126.1 hypothetical protein PR003_g11169 [Phytophthora rubi]
MPSTAVLRLVLLLALGLSLSALSANGASEFEEVAASKPRDIADDHVRVQLCTSCGFQQNFQQLRTYLEDTFPHLVDRVESANYDVDPFKMMLAQFLGYAQATAMILLVFGEFILPALGVDVTALRWALNNRVAAFFIVVFMGTIASSLTASGGFEIYFNGDLIFSKLETGRWPTLLEVSNSISEYGLLDSPAA